MNRVLTNTMTVLSSMLLCTACIYDVEDEGTGSPAASTAPSTYLRIDFDTQASSATRADNTRSEETEVGQTYENAITSAAVFLYESSATDDAINETDSTTAVTCIEFTSDDIIDRTGKSTYVTTLAKEVESISPGDYHVIAVANPHSDLSNLAKLSDLQAFIEKKAWTYDATDGYHEFLMSSASDATVTLNYNTKANPATVTVKVQRMAARVDCATSSFSEDGYEVTDGTGKVKLTGAVLVNDLNSGSYLLKRVSDGEGETPTYLGEETGSNYVIDPWTEKKTGSAVTDLTYGIYYPGYASTDEQENPSYWDTNVTVPSATIDNYYRIGYTMENTTYAEYTSKEYATGVVFKGKFTPETVNNSYSSYDYYTTGTFFKWNGKFYATLEDIMYAAYGSSFSSDFGTFNSTDTWSDVETFVESLTTDPTGYKAYLKGILVDKTESNVIDPSLASTLKWSEYAKEKLGYEYESGDGVQLDQFNQGSTTSTRAELASASGNTISTYEKGQCYYTWWIRHQDDESDETNGVMEYAIVRNNVYKLTVESVSTIGGDIPSEGIIVNVKVQNWQSGGEEEVNL